MIATLTHVDAMPLPAASRLRGLYSTLDLADAFAIDVPKDTTSDPEALARFVFASSPPWVTRLMAVRDISVARLGLKTSTHLRSGAAASAAPRIGIFRIYEKREEEIVMGEDDKHLDFRVSVRYEPPTAGGASPRVVISTAVHCHNLLGKSYLSLITPAHRLVVPSFLRQAARNGWPEKTPAKC